MFRKFRSVALPGVGVAGVPPVDLLTGLVAYYRLNGDLTDSSGNGHDLSDISVSYGTGKLGQAYVGGDIGVASVADVTPPFSVSAWFRTGQLDVSGVGGVVRIIKDVLTNRSLRSTCDGAGNWTVATIGGAITASVPAGAWVHVALVVTGSGSTLYVNGASAATGVTLAGYDSIGLNPNTIAGDVGVDEVAYYSIEFSPAQILALYNNGNGRDPTA